MKIAIDVSQICFPGTGVAKYTTNLVNELVKYDKHQFLLFGYSWGRRKLFNSFFENYSSLPNVTTKLIIWPNSLVNWWGNAWHKINLEDLIGKFDILHTSDWVEFPSRNIKVTTIHDLVVYRYPEYLDIRIIKTQKQKLSWVAKESHLIFSDSQATKKDIIKYLKISERKIKVVYLGVDEQFYKRSSEEISQIKMKYNLPDKYLLFVGTREPRKNLLRLVEAFALIKKNNLQLVIAGGIKGWGEGLKENKNIQILDYVDDMDLPALYCGSIVFVYPSLYEGFGLPILEAMRCEVPVVTSNCGSLAEISGSGVTIDPESSVSISKGINQALSLNDMQRKEMVEKNLTWAKKFTWEKTASEVIKGYESLY